MPAADDDQQWRAGDARPTASAVPSPAPSAPSAPRRGPGGPGSPTTRGPASPPARPPSAPRTCPRRSASGCGRRPAGGDVVGRLIDLQPGRRRLRFRRHLRRRCPPDAAASLPAARPGDQPSGSGGNGRSANGGRRMSRVGSAPFGCAGAVMRWASPRCRCRAVGPGCGHQVSPVSARIRCGYASAAVTRSRRRPARPAHALRRARRCDPSRSAWSVPSGRCQDNVPVGHQRRGLRHRCRPSGPARRRTSPRAPTTTRPARRRDRGGVRWRAVPAAGRRSLIAGERRTRASACAARRRRTATVHGRLCTGRRVARRVSALRVRGRLSGGPSTASTESVAGGAARRRLARRSGGDRLRCAAHRPSTGRCTLATAVATIRQPSGDRGARRPPLRPGARSHAGLPAAGPTVERWLGPGSASADLVDGRGEPAASVLPHTELGDRRRGCPSRRHRRRGR